MTPRSRLALVLVLFAVPAWAGEVRLAVERVETAPQLGPPVTFVPQLTSLQPLTPALSVTPNFALPAPAVGLVPPSIAAIPVHPVAAPTAARALATVAPVAAAAEAPGRGPVAAAASPVVGDGAALFDGAKAAEVLADVARGAASRPLASGVFIQQEQEGSLIAQDSRDSSGSVFRYYRPVELRPDLVAEVQNGVKGFAKAGYGIRRALAPFSRGADAVWDAWSRDAKLAYLEKYEKAVVAERGAAAAWKGKTFLLLERSPKAPDFLAKNPDMEAPPAGYEHVPGHRFLQPEIVSGKDTPASSVGEALARTKLVISQTGHAGTQYHVFIKAEPAALEAQVAGLQAALQAFNDGLYAAAVQDSFQNVVHASLQPWHEGRSRRVASLIAAAARDPHLPAAEDADSEKHAYVGFRYWGMENGKMVVSLELRGGSIPFKARRPVARDMESPEIPKRDYDGIQRWLALLSSYAESVAKGTAPRTPVRPFKLDAAAADALLAARAETLGLSRDGYLGVAELSERFTGQKGAAPGLLAPFASSQPGSAELNRFMDEWLKVSASVRSLEASGGRLADARRFLEYQLWNAYAAWGRSHEPKARAQLASILAR